MAEPAHRPDRTLVISNAASGANARLGIQGVRDAAAAAGMRHHCIRGVAGLDGILRRSAEARDSLIVVNAGDGTVCRILDLIRGGRLFTPEPALALLRGGTTNMIHNDVGFAGRPQAGLERLLDCLQRGRYGYRRRHLLRVRQTGRSVTRYGFFLGTHAVVRAILRARSRLHERVSTGRLSELISIAAMLWRLLRRRVHDDAVLAPVALELSRGGGPWRETGHILLLAMTVHTAILGLRPLARGQRAGLAVLSWPEYRLMPLLRRALYGGLEELDRVSLRGEFGWILDGEIYQHGADDGELSIDVDEPVRFLVGGSRP